MSEGCEIASPRVPREAASMTITAVEHPHVLTAAGLPEEDVLRWTQAAPALGPNGAAAPDGLGAAREAAARYFQEGSSLLRRLPPRPQRSDREAAAAQAIKE